MSKKFHKRYEKNGVFMRKMFARKFQWWDISLFEMQAIYNRKEISFNQTWKNMFQLSLHTLRQPFYEQKNIKNPFKGSWKPKEKFAHNEYFAGKWGKKFRETNGENRYGTLMRLFFNKWSLYIKVINYFMF